MKLVQKKDAEIKKSTNLCSPAGQMLKHKYEFPGFKIIQYKNDLITIYTFYK
jgi:hypothetical protein